MRQKAKLNSDEMVALRRGGRTLEDIARIAGVCPTRASQIIRKVAPGERWTVKKSNPKEFIGAKLNADVKAALKLHVKETGQSISAFIGDAIEEKLTRLGVVIPRTPINRGEPLPFEETA